MTSYHSPGFMKRAGCGSGEYVCDFSNIPDSCLDFLNNPNIYLHCHAVTRGKRAMVISGCEQDGEV